MYTITFQVEESLIQLFIYVGKDQMGQRSMVKLGEGWGGLRRSNLKIIGNDRMGSFKNEMTQRRTELTVELTLHLISISVKVEGWLTTCELKTFFHWFARDVLIFYSFEIVTSLICYNEQPFHFLFSDSCNTWNNQHFNLFWGVWLQWIHETSASSKKNELQDINREKCMWKFTWIMRNVFLFFLGVLYSACWD